MRHSSHAGTQHAFTNQQSHGFSGVPIHFLSGPVVPLHQRRSTGAWELLSPFPPRIGSPGKACRMTAGLVSTLTVTQVGDRGGAAMVGGPWGAKGVFDVLREKIHYWFRPTHPTSSTQTPTSGDNLGSGEVLNHLHVGRTRGWRRQVFPHFAARPP